MNKQIFLHYLDRNEELDKDIDVAGYFTLLKEDHNFLVVKSEKNTIRIPYHRIIKCKEVRDK